jgi:hypoxanthine phosphoribosyltransferase
MEIPGNYKLVYNSSQIKQRIAQLGEEISKWAVTVNETTGQDLLAVCILRGGHVFFSDLVRAIEPSVEVEFCRSWSYYSDSNAQKDAKKVRISVEEIVAQGRNILLVDDICDTGATLLKLHDVFLNLGAEQVKTAVFIHRQVSTSVYNPTWSGFQYSGLEWFVGYGMEDCNRYANLPETYTIDKQ